MEMSSTSSTRSSGAYGKAHILATKASAYSTRVVSADLNFSSSEVGCMLRFSFSYSGRLCLFFMSFLFGNIISTIYYKSLATGKIRSA
jgi:hypothetical protein